MTLSMDLLDTDQKMIGFDIPEYHQAPSSAETSLSDKISPSYLNKPIVSSMSPVNEKEKIYIDDYEILKPALEPPEKSRSTPSSHIEIIIKLMDLSQKLIQDDEAISMLKVDAMGKRLEDNKQEINKITKDKHQLEAVNDRWEWRKALATNILYAITTAAGAGLLACGEPISGSSLLISGLGGITSSIMNYFGINQQITQPIATISGLIGAVGSIGSAIYNPSQIFNTFISGAQFISGLVANAFTGYANYAQSEIQSNAANYDSLHTTKEKERRLLDEKMTGALTSHKSTLMPLSNVLKSLTKAQKRVNTTIENMLRGQFV